MTDRNGRTVAGYFNFPGPRPLPDPPPDPFVRLPEIAGRLGVEPLPAEAPHPGFQIALQDGRRYDLFELLAALLDRMDEVHVGSGR
ncbi:MAG TPA: hypothetical protein VEW06_06340 [Xanthobacteraceae bacterium]|nr:hypothetical protein [Xanthobacteraceae bacterium]